MGKRKKKKKKSSLKFKWLFIIGGLSHFIMYSLLEFTYYSDSLLWGSLVFCGVVSGMYLIVKMDLLNPKSYRKLKGIKLKAYMFTICFFLIIGATIMFGNIINGAIIGLNYFGRDRSDNRNIYTVEKIEKHRNFRRRRVTRIFRRYSPKVYFTKDNRSVNRILPETFKSQKYVGVKRIELNEQQGLFGFVIIRNYQLLK